MLSGEDVETSFSLATRIITVPIFVSCFGFYGYFHNNDIEAPNNCDREISDLPEADYKENNEIYDIIKYFCRFEFSFCIFDEVVMTS